MEKIFADRESLLYFVKEVLMHLGVSEKDAEITANVLVLSDQRGIGSHGVARLKRYIDGIKTGIIKTDKNIDIVKETPVSMIVDGNGGLGQVIAYNVMNKLISKAKTSYMAFASIRNSNHYGIAGYYSLMAVEKDMIGISMTSAAPLVLPTHGKTAVFGTNPISVGIPSNKETAFLLDMATSTVPRGKLEVYGRQDKKMPLTWATDNEGIAIEDPNTVLENLLARKGGGLLPLGGMGEETSGHKGFGLAMLVEIFCGILSDGYFGLQVYKDKGKPPGVCHFLGVIKPNAFCGLDKIKENTGDFIDMCRNSPKAKGRDYIYYPGEKEYKASLKYKEFVPLDYAVFDNLSSIAKEYGKELFKYKT